MADAEKYARWLVDNAGKKGTPEFDTVAKAYKAARNVPVDQSYVGSVLPFRKDAEGNRSFDSNVGILGTMKRVGSIAGDALTGELTMASPDAIPRMFEAAMMMSPMSAAARAEGRLIPGESAGRTKVRPKAPTAEELKAASGRNYDQIRDMDIAYRTPAVNKMARDAQMAMEREGFRAEQSPSTFSILGDLQKSPQGSVAYMANLDSARKALNKAAGNFNNPAEQEAARRAIRALDDFISQADPQSLVAGTSAAEGKRAADLLSDARGNYAAAKRSAKVTGAVDDAILQAESTNSGKNIGNAIRQKLRQLVTSDKLARGFSDQELAQIEKVVRGTGTQNAIRHLSNVLGGGGGMMQHIATATGAAGGAAVGGAVGSPATGAAIGAFGAPAMGAGARQLYNMLVRRAVSVVDDLVRTRSPLYQQLLQDAPYARVSPVMQSVQGALAKALLAQTPQAAAPQVINPYTGKPVPPA